MENMRKDEELVVDIKEGDVKAFEFLVKKYQNPLYVFVNRIVRQGLEVEDIIQETFLKIYKNIDRFDVNKKFSTWTFEIAKNTAISYIRKNKKKFSINDFEISVEEKNYEEIIRLQEAERIRDNLLKIDKKYRKVVGLYYFKDLSYEEISRKLKIPINTVRTRLRRGKKELKGLLT